MRLRPTQFALSWIAIVSACSAVQDESQDSQPLREPAPAVVANPMASFARLVSGEWAMTAENGTSMFDTWLWGPGEHSVRVMTDGAGAEGKPWRELQVMYWHPGRKQVRLLGVSPFARGVSEGAITFEGETANALLDLYQAGGVYRELNQRWTFHGPDKYHERLLEKNDAGEFAPLVAWDHTRSTTTTAPRAHTAEPTPKPSEHLEALESLLGHTWKAKSEESTGAGFDIHSTFEWIPYADAIYARTLALHHDGEPLHLLDAYLYHHTGANTLRCLALSHRGDVYEGDLTVLDGGAWQLDVKGFEDERVISLLARFDPEPDGALRQRVWSLEGAERKLVIDLRHRKAQANL